MFLLFILSIFILPTFTNLWIIISRLLFWYVFILIVEFTLRWWNFCCLVLIILLKLILMDCILCLNLLIFHLSYILRWNILAVSYTTMHLICNILKIIIFFRIILGNVRTSNWWIDLCFWMQKLYFSILLYHCHFIFHILLMHQNIILFLI